MRKMMTAALAGLLAAVLATPAAATVTPSGDILTVPAGSSGSTAAVVGVPAVPAKADVLIAIDTTGSMLGAINQAKAEATALVTSVQGTVPDTNFAVVDFKDAVDGPGEYVVRQAMTDQAALVQGAINAMTVGGGGDTPEASNLVFRNSYADPTIGWRADSRKFVIVITDAEPHVGVEPVPTEINSCDPTLADPDGLSTIDELAAMTANQRTLFMIYPAGLVPALQSCFAQIAALGFSGSAAAQLGSNFATQVLGLITAATGNVSTIEMAVAAAPAGAAASWISFTPPSYNGSFPTPVDEPFDITATVPPNTPAGPYVFDLVGLADGGDVGHFELTVNVPPAEDGELTITKTVDDATPDRGDKVTYTITIHNGTADAAKVKHVIDLLPKKVRYVKGSAIGGGKPKVRHSHRELTFRGPFTIPAGGDFAITFDAKVKLKHGCAKNRAWAKLKPRTVLRTGPTAEICVGQDDDDDDDHHGHGGGGGGDDGPEHDGGNDRGSHGGHGRL